MPLPRKAIPTPNDLLRQARLKAGLTQRQLAVRAGTAQSVVARIERGDTSPSWDTLRRLLSAAGFLLRVDLEPAPVADTHMLADGRRILALPPEQRLVELANISRLLLATRRA